MAHLASVRPLIDTALAARTRELVGETPLLLSFEACAGRPGDNIYTRQMYAFHPPEATKISDHYYTEW
jgi:hypothetical protein